mmetsp:Transcript_5779/g.9673  ORF Transcript_5779/g.9673 Transcript_5779/m.9673 type:complete len:180 (+) Transcript_5779:48-587(+)
MSAVFVLLASAVMTHVLGHMCALSPYQRGGIVPDEDLNNVGQAQCGNANVNSTGAPNGIAPCYGQSRDDERITNFIGRGAYQPMVVYKNEQHYNADNPGNFTWNLYEFNTATDEYKFITTLGSKRDTDNGDLTNFQIEPEIPFGLNGEHYVVQSIYYTNQKIYANTTTFFVQCSDVLLI